MTRSRELGMQTFDHAVFDLYKAGRISYDVALRNTDSVNEVRLKIKLEKDGNDEDVADDFCAGLEVEPDLQDVSVQQQQSKAASVSAGLALLTDHDYGNSLFQTKTPINSSEAIMRWSTLLTCSHNLNISNFSLIYRLI